MTKEQIKLYFDYDTEELVNVLYNEEVYYVMQMLEDTEEYTVYEIDEMQNAIKSLKGLYWECTDSSILTVFKDDTKHCVLNGKSLEVINR